MRWDSGCLLVVMGLAVAAALSLPAGPAMALDEGALVAKSITGGAEPLGVIVEKDLFSPSRQKPRPKPKPKPKAEPIKLPPPKAPPPSVTLIGTVLLDTGSQAILSWQGAPSGSDSYGVGDLVGGFVITEITSDAVLLRRDDELLRVAMPSSSPSGASARSSAAPAQQEFGAQGPRDIPAALLPGRRRQLTYRPAPQGQEVREQKKSEAEGASE